MGSPRTARASARARARGGRLSSYRNLSPHSPRHRISSEGGGGQPDFFRLRAPAWDGQKFAERPPAFPRCGWDRTALPTNEGDGLRYGDCGQGVLPLACEPSDGPCPHQRGQEQAPMST